MWWYSGLSLRKISRNIGDYFNIDIDFSTIYSWIKRYIPVISEHVNSLKPQLGDTWHADELFVKMKGGETRKGESGIACLWNVSCRNTEIQKEQSEHLMKQYITLMVRLLTQSIQMH
jgi:hypothetical protein